MMSFIIVGWEFNTSIKTVLDLIQQHSIEPANPKILRLQVFRHRILRSAIIAGTGLFCASIPSSLKSASMTLFAICVIYWRVKTRIGRIVHSFNPSWPWWSTTQKCRVCPPTFHRCVDAAHHHQMGEQTSRLSCRERVPIRFCKTVPTTPILKHAYPQSSDSSEAGCNVLAVAS